MFKNASSAVDVFTYPLPDIGRFDKNLKIHQNLVEVRLSEAGSTTSFSEDETTNLNLQLNRNNRVNFEGIYNPIGRNRRQVESYINPKGNDLKHFTTHEINELSVQRNEDSTARSKVANLCKNVDICDVKVKANEEAFSILSHTNTGSQFNPFRGAVVDPGHKNYTRERERQKFNNFQNQIAKKYNDIHSDSSEPSVLHEKYCSDSAVENGHITKREYSGKFMLLISFTSYSSYNIIKVKPCFIKSINIAMFSKYQTNGWSRW